MCMNISGILLKLTEYIHKSALLKISADFWKRDNKLLSHPADSLFKAFRLCYVEQQRFIPDPPDADPVETGYDGFLICTYGLKPDWQYAMQQVVIR